MSTSTRESTAHLILIRLLGDVEASRDELKQGFERIIMPLETRTEFSGRGDRHERGGVLGPGASFSSLLASYRIFRRLDIM